MSYAEPDEWICRDCGRAYIREYKGSTEYCPECEQQWIDMENEQKIQAARDKEL